MATGRFVARAHPGHYAESASANDASEAAPGRFARSLRRRLGLTLEQLAQRSGLSKGHLSRFERGEKSLSIAALIRLSKALHTSVSALLGEHAAEDFVHVVRAGERTPRRAAKPENFYEFIPLSRTDGQTGASAFIVHLDETAAVGKEAFHEGEEMFFVLSGSVEMALETRSMLLRQGDFVQFPGLMKHYLRGLEPDTSILVIIS